MGKIKGTGRTLQLPPSGDRPKKKKTEYDYVKENVISASGKLSLSGLPKKEIKYWQDMIKRTIDEGRLKTGSGSYSPLSRDLNLEKEDFESVIYHEFGHMLDFTYRGDSWTSHSQNVTNVAHKYFQGSTAYKEDLANLAKEIGLKVKTSGTELSGTIDNNRRAYRKWWMSNKWMAKDDTGSLSDIISAMTKEKVDAIHVGGGHERKYWNRDFGSGSTQSEEVFAEYMALRQAGQRKMLGEFKRLTPNLYRIMQKRYERLFK